MDGDTGKILSRILGKGDLEKVPADILVKVEKFYDQHFEEFLTTKAKYDIAKRNVGMYIEYILGFVLFVRVCCMLYVYGKGNFAIVLFFIGC